MYDSRYPPHLKLERTISHPTDTARVIGFEARDTLYGRAAVVVKLDEMMVDDVGVQTPDGHERYTVFGFHDPVIRKARSSEALYVLGTEEVYAAPCSVVNGTAFHTFETEHGTDSLQAVRADEFHAYERSAVKVE